MIGGLLCHRLCEGHAVLCNLLRCIVLIFGVVSFTYDKLLCSQGLMSLAESVAECLIDKVLCFRVRFCSGL